jgi:hypothetical protein
LPLVLAGLLDNRRLALSLLLSPEKLSVLVRASGGRETVGHRLLGGSRSCGGVHRRLGHVLLPLYNHTTQVLGGYLADLVLGEVGILTPILSLEISQLSGQGWHLVRRDRMPSWGPCWN